MYIFCPPLIKHHYIPVKTEINIKWISVCLLIYLWNGDSSETVCTRNVATFSVWNYYISAISFKMNVPINTSTIIHILISTRFFPIQTSDAIELINSKKTKKNFTWILTNPLTCSTIMSAHKDPCYLLHKAVYLNGHSLTLQQINDHNARFAHQHWPRGKDNRHPLSY